MRVGLGYDSHPLVGGRSLVLGGVPVPFSKGLSGHSDGDALTHAIIDALLGAASLGDIGSYFPSTDIKYKDASSIMMLNQVRALLKEHRWQVVNVDATILAETPPLKGFILAMRQKLAECLEVDVGRVGVKAKSTNGLGFVGRSEGMAVYSVVLLEGND